MRHRRAAARRDRRDEIAADYDEMMGADAEDADDIGAEIRELYGMAPGSQEFGAKVDKIAKRLEKLKARLEKVQGKREPRGLFRRFRARMREKRIGRLERRIEKLTAKLEEAGGGADAVDPDADLFDGYGRGGNWTPSSAHKQIARIPTIGAGKDARDRALHNNPHHRPGHSVGRVHAWGGSADRDARDRQIHRGGRWR